MMTIIIILLSVGIILFGMGKAIADRVAHIDIWKQSVFRRFKVDGFFGEKNQTWKRKRRSKYKLVRLLFSYPLVFLTDIWHFGNFIEVTGIMMVVTGAYLIQDSPIGFAIALLPIIYYGRTLMFNLFYHVLLYKKKG